MEIDGGAEDHGRSRLRLRAWSWAATAILLGASLTSGPAWAHQLPERPAGAQILPGNTVAVITCADTRVLRDRFRESAYYQMSQDEQLRPLITALYGNAVDALAQIQERLGIEFAELLDITAGELTLALVAPPQQRPELVMIADTDPLSPIVPRLLEGLERWVQESGGTVDRQQRDGVELTICGPIPGPLEQLVYLRRDETFILTTSQLVMNELLANWSGTEIEGSETGLLSEAHSYVVAMHQTEIQGELGAQIRWWVDPVSLVFSLARGRIDAQIVLTLVPVLGIDHFKGIGGTVSFGNPTFDQVHELHVYVEPPRDGVWKAIATQPGDCEPESWVPIDSASYLTFHVDPSQAMGAVTTIYDTLRGEGALREFLRNGPAAQRLGVDLKADVWDRLSGRVTHVTWFDPEPSLGAQRTLIGLHLSDPGPFRETWQGVVSRMADRLERDELGGVEIQMVRPAEAGQERQTAQGRSPLQPRLPRPSFAIVNDYFLVADQPTILRQAILASQNTTEALNADADFRFMVAQMDEETDGAPAVARSFHRPEPMLRNMYLVLQSSEVQRLLAERARTESFWESVKKSLDEHPLPPFTVLEQYLSPSGGMWVEQDSGWHYTGMGLRRDAL